MNKIYIYFFGQSGKKGVVSKSNFHQKSNFFFFFKRKKGLTFQVNRPAGIKYHHLFSLK